MPSFLPMTGGAGEAAVSINGKVYVAPRNSLGVTSSLVYDVATDRWTDSWNGPAFTDASGATVSMYFYALTALGNRIFMIGGLDANSLSTSSKYNFAYDTVTGSWTRWADMPTARWGLVAVTVDGLTFAMGGGGSCHVPALTGSCVANEAYTPSDSHSPAAPVQSTAPNLLSWVAGIVISATIVTVLGLFFFRRRKARESHALPNQKDEVVPA